MSRIYQNLGDKELSETDRLQWQFANESYEPELERRDIGQYVYDKELSDKETAVWHNHTDKRTHVANRGSTTAYDWAVSDLQIGLGIEGMGSRFKKAERETKEAHDKYGYTTDVSGHSLGGSITTHLTQRLGNNATASEHLSASKFVMSRFKRLSLSPTNSVAVILPATFKLVRLPSVVL